MSDLISRSDLIHKIRGIVPGSQDVDFIVGLIENQPTAFDTERVVEQLEERTLNSKSAQTEAIIGMCGASANYYHGEADAYINAIDIVKKGGVE